MQIGTFDFDRFSCAGDIPIILVGTNLHLQIKREVSREEGMLMAEKYNLSGYIEVSAKTGQNVEKAFEQITKSFLEMHDLV